MKSLLVNILCHLWERTLFQPFVLTSKIAEEVESVVFNVEPYQYEPNAMESHPGTSADSSDCYKYNVNKD